MDCSSIEVKVISCRDIKAFNFFQKLSMYAIVSVVNEESKKNQHERQKQLDAHKTPVDRDGDANPEWNRTLNFDLKSINRFDNLFLKFYLRNEGFLFGNRSIGEVQVPFKDLIEDFHGAVRYVSYQIRNSNGHPNGVLNFAYKLIGKEKTKLRSSIDCSSINPTPINFHSTEIQTKSKNLLYPSLDDVLSPLPSITVSSPSFCYSTPKSYGYGINSTLIMPVPYYRPSCPSPPAQFSGTSHWSSIQPKECGYNLRAYYGYGHSSIGDS